MHFIMSVSLTGFARRLVQNNLLTEEAAAKAVQESREAKINLIDYVVQKKLAPAAAVATAVSMEFGDPVLDLAAFSPEYLPKDLVDHTLVERHRALPLFKRGNRLFVAKIGR